MLGMLWWGSRCGSWAPGFMGDGKETNSRGNRMGAKIDKIGSGGDRGPVPMGRQVEV